MAGGSHSNSIPVAGRPLQAYLLGPLGFDAAESFQRWLAYDVSGGGGPAVVFCEHPAGITVGREGSRLHIRLTEEELQAQRWPLRWVSRGGGVMLHLTGQVAAYPVLSLAQLQLTPAAYVEALLQVGRDLVSSFGVATEIDRNHPGIRVRGRRVLHVGATIRSGVTAFGLIVNVSPDLALFRDIECDGDPLPMTSLQRECPTPARPQAVRQRLLDLFAARFGFDRVSVFHQHPTFHPKPTRHALAPRSR